MIVDLRYLAPLTELNPNAGPSPNVFSFALPSDWEQQIRDIVRDEIDAALLRHQKGECP